MVIRRNFLFEFFLIQHSFEITLLFFYECQLLRVFMLIRPDFPARSLATSALISQCIFLIICPASLSIWKFSKLVFSLFKNKSLKLQKNRECNSYRRDKYTLQHEAKHESSDVEMKWNERGKSIFIWNSQVTYANVQSQDSLLKRCSSKYFKISVHTELRYKTRTKIT